jgi:hypothetical protein
MSVAMKRDKQPECSEDVPQELVRLRERIGSLPARLRAELGPLAEDAVEQALFRGRVLSVAREGLERYRLDLAIVRFDLDATRREREALRRRLESAGA